MKTLDVNAIFLLAVWSAQPLAASELEVVAATGVLEPEGLQVGQQLSGDTRLGLEPWGRAVIRETTGCGLTHVVVGVGEHVLTPAQDCSDTQDPMQVVARIQQGEAFAARIKETGSGPADDVVLALSLNPCVFLPRLSEEGVNRRECPSGYALRGLRCSGAFCDDKDLMCCPYLQGAPDPSTKAIQARRISEEFPNSVFSKRFLNGLTCEGPYCDNLLPQPFKSSRLGAARECDWSAWESERPGAWLDCGPGKLMAGIRCKGDYCADVGLYCCVAQVE